MNDDRVFGLDIQMQNFHYAGPLTTDINAFILIIEKRS